MSVPPQSTISDETDASHPIPSVETDITMVDSGGSEPQSARSTPVVTVKAEPSDEDSIMSTTLQIPEMIAPPTEDGDYPPLPDLGTTDLDDEDFTAGNFSSMNEEFEQSMAAAQQEFNRSSLPEETPVIDEDYEEALKDVDEKRVEVAKMRSMNMDVTADEIELQKLEDKLFLARKNKMRSERHVKQERQQSSMFFAEGEVSDEDVELSQAPARREPLAISIVDISDDEEDGFKAKIKTGQKRKYNRKIPAASKAAKKPKTTRKGPRRDNAEMLNMGSLIRNNIVADAQANQGLREQPGFVGKKTKAGALTALLASIPEQDRETTTGMRKKMDLACKAFSCNGRGSMQADGVRGWKLKGMASSLKHFQLLSTAWGVERERGSTAPFGGMLADTMGYGKTVQMITIMVENRPVATAKNRTTLIVVPAAITTQWMEEFAKHVNDGVMEDVFVYKAGSRPVDENSMRFLKRQQVVITTYNEVMRNYPKAAPPTHLTTDKAKDAWWDQYYLENRGPLLKMKFHRVILDEAQIIKNHEARTSKACRLLAAKYKWVLTGTPLSNRMEELFPYFQFLGVEGSATFAQFQHNYAQRNDLTMARLDAMLRTVMIRRTGSSRLFGAPLTSLPALDYHTIEIPFNPVEKAIYAVVRQRFIARINDWSRSNKMNQISKNIFVMLTRLRQMCAHVLMVSTTMRDLLESEDIERLWKSIERHSVVGDSTGRKTVNVLRKIMREARDEHEEAEATPPPSIDVDNNHNTIDLTIDDDVFDYREFFYKLQRDGAWDTIRSRSQCCQCGEIPEEDSGRLSVPCGHLYCQECILLLLESAQDAGTEAECTSCHNYMSGAADLSAMDQIAAEARQKPSRTPSQPAPRQTKKGSKGKAKESEHKWLAIPGVEKLSSKAQAIESTVAEWVESDPNAKIVMFTLWVPMIKVLGKVCSRRGWGYAEYSGKVPVDQRNKSLAKFKSSPPEEQRVLIMSTRAGGLGLNVIEASYCCIVDPWWNEPMEDQAFSRLYRIGQIKDCVVRRFLVKDTIDTQLMLYLQKIKAQECDRVIDGRPNNKLTTQDMVKLFGPTKKDPRTGQPIIEEGKDVNDDFIISSESVVIDDSEDERVMPAPARPREE